MTRDTIIALAREAGGHVSSFHGRWVMYTDDLERFAALVAAHEREACAKVCDDLWEDDGTAYDCAAAIRSRT
jgi:hypothetical protein